MCTINGSASRKGAIDSAFGECHTYLTGPTLGMDAASEPFLRVDADGGALAAEAGLAQPRGAIESRGGGGDNGGGGGAHGGSVMATTNMDSLPGGSGSTSKPQTISQHSDAENGGGRCGLCGGGGDNVAGGLGDAWAGAGAATETRFPWASLVIFVAVYAVGVALGLATDEESHLMSDHGVSFFILWGSGLSLVSCGVVVWSFVVEVASRRHPSPIVFYRTLTNLVSAVCMIYSNSRVLWEGEQIVCGEGLGRIMSSIFEFTAITSEGWFVVLIIDLLSSLTNPFADYRANMRRYHTAVWSLGILALSGINSCPLCQGELTPGVCWFKMEYEWRGSCLWTLYLAWICVFYAFGTYQIIYAKCYLIGSHHLSKVSGAGSVLLRLTVASSCFLSLPLASSCFMLLPESPARV